MSETLPRPLPEIFHGLGGGGVIEPAKLVVTADDTHHFDVDDVGCRMMGSAAERRRTLSANVPSTTTSYRHDASTTSIGPRSTSLSSAASTSAWSMSAGRRRVRASHSSTVGRLASRVASRRSSRDLSDQLRPPVAGARHRRRRQRSRIWIVFGISPTISCKYLHTWSCVNTSPERLSLRRGLLTRLGVSRVAADSGTSGNAGRSASATLGSGWRSRRWRGRRCQCPGGGSPTTLTGPTLTACPDRCVGGHENLPRIRSRS